MGKFISRHRPDAYTTCTCRAFALFRWQPLIDASINQSLAKTHNTKPPTFLVYCRGRQLLCVCDSCKIKLHFPFISDAAAAVCWRMEKVKGCCCNFSLFLTGNSTVYYCAHSTASHKANWPNIIRFLRFNRFGFWGKINFMILTLSDEGIAVCGNAVN